ncbi:MAG: M81 family metallopeptidase [Pirellulales bacterium]|nr:M81 family metallopeptidase [Pirellulales bacterium]
MNRPHRIAIGALFTECNHFGGRRMDLAWFARTQLAYGEELLQTQAGALGGALEVLRAADVQLAPLLAASACPGGVLTAACYNHLRGEVLSQLDCSAPVDGVLLVLHGAAAAENAPDLEGDLLAAVRARIGPEAPLVATLDLHAHVTADMVRNATALLAWETYPHQDAHTTGQRAARLLLAAVQGRVRPAMALAKVPVVVAALNGHTEGEGPFAEVMRLAKSLEQQPGVLSTSAFMVHPYLDLPEMGGGGLVITDNDPSLAAQLARQIATAYWERRGTLEPRLYAPAEALRAAADIPAGPVLLVETADCCGGGAAGDSVHALRALLEAGVTEPCLVPVVDPAAVRAAQHAGILGRIALRLGHQVDPQWGEPVEVTGVVRRLGDGRFRYAGGIFAGTWGEMGPTAVLEVGSIRILIASGGTYDYADEQYRSVGLDPRQARFVVVKNPMNYRFAYDGVARAAFVLDTPGPTPPTTRRLPYRRLTRPCFPLDEDMPEITPHVMA